MADVVAINSKRCGNGCAGMAIFPLLTGLRTWSTKTLRPRMCTTTPSSSQVTLCKYQNIIRPGPHSPYLKNTEAIEQKGDPLISDLFQNDTDSVHDMRVVKNYAKSYLTKTPEKCLQEAERAKKNMYLEACLQQLQHFSPFVAS